MLLLFPALERNRFLTQMQTPPFSFEDSELDE